MRSKLWGKNHPTCPPMVYAPVAGSTAAKAIASRLASATQTEVDKKEAGRTVAKEILLKAILMSVKMLL